MNNKTKEVTKSVDYLQGISKGEPDITTIREYRFGIIQFH